MLEFAQFYVSSIWVWLGITLGAYLILIAAIFFLFMVVACIAVFIDAKREGDTAWMTLDQEQEAAKLKAAILRSEANL